MKLFLSFLFLIIAQSLAWIQMFGQFRWPSLMKEKIWIPIACSIPITIFFMLGAAYAKDIFDGKAWPVRMIAFSTGILVFSFLTNLYLGETINMKNVVSVLLALIIVLIQIFWK